MVDTVESATEFYFGIRGYPNLPPLFSTIWRRSSILPDVIIPCFRLVGKRGGEVLTSAKIEDLGQMVENKGGRFGFPLMNLNLQNSLWSIWL